MDELTRRAYSAYFRMGTNLDQPAEGASGPQSHAGLNYVVLRNTNGVLAVYRIRNDGMLKRLRRWPRALEDY